MTVVVQLVTEPADAQTAVAAATELGVRLVPMHPGVPSADLASWHVVASGSSDDDEATAAALRDLPGVSAAFVRPDAEPA